MKPCRSVSSFYMQITRVVIAQQHETIADMQPAQRAPTARRNPFRHSSTKWRWRGSRSRDGLDILDTR